MFDANLEAREAAGALPAARLPVLAVLHRPTSTPGHVGQELNRLGFALDVRRRCRGDPLPMTLAEHVGVVIFGGPGSANDGENGMPGEVDWVGIALRERKPLLGICLGAQILAKHLGARVGPDPDGQVEVGYHRIRPTPGAVFAECAPEHVYHWHREGFELPHGASLLAAADGPFEIQAFSYGETAVGVQFHPEITYGMVSRWTVRSAHRLGLPGAQDRASQLASHIAHGPAVRRWLSDFLPRWLACAGSQRIERL
jgi:GMP synthase (glutamine-hydrolysing)